MERNTIAFPQGMVSSFYMIDVGCKRPTRRYAVACGTIHLGFEAFDAVQSKKLPKGDVLALAEVAGIMGAKNTPALIPMCHTLPLDQVSVHFELDETKKTITTYVQAVAFAKTGVEMEALAGVHAALLTIWDLTKAVNPSLSMENMRLLVKTGGKSGIWVNPSGIPDWLLAQLPRADVLAGRKAAVIVMSDRAAQGQYKDESGALLNKFLKNAGADVQEYKVIPDVSEAIATAIKTCCNKLQPDLLITSGGTGPGPRDITPDVLHTLCDRMLDGFGEFLRAESLHYTDTAWLSRMTAGMIGPTLVIALPGSPKAVAECWEIITPFIGDVLQKIRKQGYEVAA